MRLCAPVIAQFVLLGSILALIIPPPDPLGAAGWILGHGANLNGVALDRVHPGFGDRLVWVFGQGEKDIRPVSSVDLIVGGPSIDKVGPELAASLHRLREAQGLKNSRFIMIWVTPSWQPEWYPPTEIQNALNNGITPVFLDWFFGDGLLVEDPKSYVRERLDEYAEHSRRLGRFLGQFDGDILVSVEPELNKKAIEAWPEFGHLIRKHGIAEIRKGIGEINAATGRRTKTFFGVTLTDNGLRNVDQYDAVYGTKSKGDSYGWTLSRPLLEVLRPDLDFVGFQQLLSQFHRDPDFPQRAVINTPEEIGLTDLPERMVNYSRYLKEQLGIPILIPYLGLPTSTWHDDNGDGKISPKEVIKLGWQEPIGNVLIGLRESYPKLKSLGVFGIGTMMLFDDPTHDLGGYQYLLENEYALGLIGTDARDGVKGEHLGTKLFPKSIDNRSFVELLFMSSK